MLLQLLFLFVIITTAVIPITLPSSAAILAQGLKLLHGLCFKSMESQAQLQKQEGESSASCCVPGRKRSSGGSYKAGAVRNRAAEKGRNRDERNRASEKGRSRAREQRKTGWKAATKAAAKEGTDVTKKANILCQEEEQQERGGNKQKE